MSTFLFIHFNTILKIICIVCHIRVTHCEHRTITANVTDIVKQFKAMYQIVGLYVKFIFDHEGTCFIYLNRNLLKKMFL